MLFESNLATETRRKAYSRHVMHTEEPELTVPVGQQTASRSNHSTAEKSRWHKKWHKISPTDKTPAHKKIQSPLSDWIF